MHHLSIERHVSFKLFLPPTALWGLNCSWYHGCSEPKHRLRSCMPLRVIVCLLFMRRSGLSGSLFPLLSNPRGRGWCGECSMLAHCELRHNVVVDLHDVRNTAFVMMVRQAMECWFRCRRMVSPKNKAHSPCTSFNHVFRVAACGTQRLPRCVPRSHYPFLIVGDKLTKG